MPTVVWSLPLQLQQITTLSVCKWSYKQAINIQILNSKFLKEKQDTLSERNGPFRILHQQLHGTQLIITYQQLFLQHLRLTLKPTSCRKLTTLQTGPKHKHNTTTSTIQELRNPRCAQESVSSAWNPIQRRICRCAVLVCNPVPAKMDAVQGCYRAGSKTLLYPDR